MHGTPEIGQARAQAVWAAMCHTQAMIEFTLDGVIGWANDTFLDAFDYRLDDVVGRHHSMFCSGQLVGSDDYRQFWEKLRCGQFHSGQYTRFGRNGRVVHLQAAYNPVLGPDGRPEGVLKIASDITVHRKRFIEQQAISTAMSRSHAVIEFGLDGTILHANDNFLELMGYGLADIVGRHHRIFCRPADRSSRAYRALWSALGRGNFASGVYQRITRDGREVWLQATYNPVLGIDGKPLKVIKSATDITAAKIRAAENSGQLDAITRAQAVIEFSTDGTILTANDNFLTALGYTVAEIAGRHHRIFVEPGYAKSPEYATFWRRLRAGEFIAAEFKRIGKNGRDVWIQASYNPIFGPDGRVMKIIKFATDVTGRMHAVQEIGAQLRRVAAGDFDCRIKEPFIPALDPLRIDFNISVEALRNARAEASEALRNMSNGMVMVAADGTIRLYNDRVLQLLGLTPDQLQIGMSLDRYVHNFGANVGWDDDQTRRVIANHRDWMASNSTTRIEQPFDHGKIISIACQPMKCGGAVITYDDVTEVRDGQKQIAHMAFHDALTGLPNRRSFVDHIARMATRSAFTLLMLDLDRFKEVNDSFGHAVGDRVLAEVALRLRDVCRHGDKVFRLGGDELAILAKLPEDEAHALANRLVGVLTRPFQIGEHLISIGGSVGLVMSGRGDDPELLQRMADLALYRAKENGRSRVEVYREGMIEEAAQRRRLETELASALAAGQFELYYQPLYDLPSCALSGFEALIRWHHPERGIVVPTDFIHLAEQNGAIVEIGKWVLEEACRQAALWPAHIYVSINVSPVQLRSVDIIRLLGEALNRHQLPPRRIEIEITETAMVENCDEIAAVLAGLRRLGVRIAMDDFGTGYSSLAHLREFELDRIKIDRSFINASHSDPGSAAVVRAVTSMARDLAIATTGEGVENEEQLANLIALGCGTAQGYLLSKPLDSAFATALIEEKTQSNRAA